MTRKNYGKIDRFYTESSKSEGHFNLAHSKSLRLQKKRSKNCSNRPIHPELSGQVYILSLQLIEAVISSVFNEKTLDLPFTTIAYTEQQQTSISNPLNFTPEELTSKLEQVGLNRDSVYSEEVQFQRFWTSFLNEELSCSFTNKVIQIAQKIIQSLYYKQSQQHDAVSISSGREVNLKKLFRQVNQLLSSQDIFSIKQSWESYLLPNLRAICSSWDVYQHELRQTLLFFVRMIELKKQKFKELYQIIYPGVNSIIPELLRLLQITSTENTIRQFIKKQEKLKRREFLDVEQLIKDIYKQLEIQSGITKDHFSDILLQKYIQSERSLLNNQKSEYLIENKKTKIKLSLKKFISQMNPYYQNKIWWKNALDKISAMIFNSTQILSEKAQQMKMIKARHFEKIEDYESVETKCLGCPTSFIEGQDILQDFSQAPVIAYPSVFQVQKMKEELLNKICALLNQGGGFILFGCQAQYRKIFTNGQVITEARKEQLLNYFASLTSFFYPKITFKKEISLTFVPVCENPLNHINNQSSEERVKKFIKGTYVARIIVKPLFGQYVYSWVENDHHTFTVFSQGKIQKVNSTKLLKIIKQKFHSHYLPERLADKSRSLNRKPFSYFDHECPLTQLEIITNRMKESEREQRSGVQPEMQFTYISLLICKPSHVSRIKQLLAAQNIQFLIQTDRFKSYKFRSAKYTALMYHNLSYDQLLRKITLNRDFIFDNKQLLAINISQYLKLENRSQNNHISKDQYTNLKNWLHNEFPAQQLRVWSFQKPQEKTQMYIGTQSRLARVFLYYVLNDFNQKASFKNPKNLQKMSRNQLQTHFKELTQNYKQEK